MPSPKLRQFIELQAEIDANHGSARAFARKTGLDKSLVNRLLNGRIKRWDPSLVAAVSFHTEGRVGLNEFIAFAQRLNNPEEAESDRVAA